VLAWLATPELVALVRDFNGPRPRNGLLDVNELQAWSSVTWDFRAGRERNLVDPNSISGPLAEAVEMAASALGLRSAAGPLADHYDAVLMLGGLVRACVWRPEYASVLLQSRISADAVVALTGFRTLNEAEQALLPAFDLQGVSEEHEAMRRSLQRFFAVDVMHESVPLDPAIEPNLRTLVAEGTGDGGQAVQLVVAPSSDPTRRANTADSYAYWASEVARVRRGQRILMVTSPIYVPFQHADAVRMLGLPFGCIVETVGIDDSLVDLRGEPQGFVAVNYLQELNSTIRSLKALIDALP